MDLNLKRALLVTTASALISAGAISQKSNGWIPLADGYSKVTLEQLLVSKNDWHPYPWLFSDSVEYYVPEAARLAYVRKGEQLMKFNWPGLPASLFLGFERTGNRSGYERLSFERRENLASLVLAEVFEKKGRFMDPIINGIWAICEESFWGVPAHLNLQKSGYGLPDIKDPVVDLFASETAQEIAWIYYLLKENLDEIDPQITRRMEYEVNRRIFQPYLSHQDWKYLGYLWKKDPLNTRRVNNWNPWINSNILASALILAEDPELRAKIIYKTMETIDHYMIPFPSDGGSDEGTVYWGRGAGAFFDYADLLCKASGNKINVFNAPVVKKMGAYIYKMYIKHPYFVNYGDADARYDPDPTLLYRFGKAIDDPVLIGFSAFEYKMQHFDTGLLSYSYGVLNRALAGLSVLKELKKIRPEEPSLKDVWLPETEIMTARSKAGTSSGFYLAAYGGNNGVSHNHNDVGNFIVYYDGNPVFVDAGVQSYTAKSFGDDRYTLWNNQSSFHNLPEINGLEQHEGRDYKAAGVAYKYDKNEASLSLDLSKAYPAQAGINSWYRTIRLKRAGHVTLEDEYDLQMLKKPAIENFLTPLRVDLAHGVIYLSGNISDEKYKLNYDPNEFEVKVDTVLIDDGKPANDTGEQKLLTGRMYRVWGKYLLRIRLYCINPKLKGKYEIRLDKVH